MSRAKVLACLTLLFSLGGPVSADAANFHTNWESTSISGEQSSTQILTTPSASVTCKQASLSGTGTSTLMASLTVTPTYGECEMTTIFGSIGPINADYASSSCTYTLYAAGLLDLQCPGGTAVATFSAVLGGKAWCTISIPSQKSLKKVSYTNNNPGTKDVTTWFELQGIKSFASGPFCSKTGETTTGTLTGAYTTRASKLGVSVDFWWE